MRRCIGLHVNLHDILAKEMETVVIVVCTNEDSFHTGHDLISYVFFGRGYHIDDPLFSDVRKLMKGKDVEIIHRRCIHCRKKGVK